MDISVSKPQPVKALDVSVTDDTLTVDLADGRTLSVPLAWYPRLLHGTPEERRNWRLIGDGVGIHWPDLDEDISIEGMLLGKRSGEKQDSLQRWLDARESESEEVNQYGASSDVCRSQPKRIGRSHRVAEPKQVSCPRKYGIRRSNDCSRSLYSTDEGCPPRAGVRSRRREEHQGYLCGRATAGGPALIKDLEDLADLYRSLELTLSEAKSKTFKVAERYLGANKDRIKKDYELVNGSPSMRYD